MESKKCSRCGAVKPATDFYRYTERDPHKTGRLHAACKRCEHNARAEHRRKNPEMTAATVRRAKIKRLFGITPEDYDAMLERQGAICRRPSPDGRRLHIDHCHTTQRVRGLLCHDCNRGVGIFHDDPELLHRAGDYLSLDQSQQEQQGASSHRPASRP